MKEISVRKLQQQGNLKAEQILRDGMQFYGSLYTIEVYLNSVQYMFILGR